MSIFLRGMFFFFTRSEGIRQFCCFSAWYPEELVIVLFYQMQISLSESPFGRGALPRLPTKLENGYVFVWGQTDCAVLFYNLIFICLNLFFSACMSNVFFVFFLWIIMKQMSDPASLTFLFIFLVWPMCDPSLISEQWTLVAFADSWSKNNITTTLWSLFPYTDIFCQ